MSAACRLALVPHGQQAMPLTTSILQCLQSIPAVAACSHQLSDLSAWPGRSGSQWWRSDNRSPVSMSLCLSTIYAAGLTRLMTSDGGRLSRCHADVIPDILTGGRPNYSVDWHESRHSLWPCMLIYGQKRTAHANMSAHADSQLLNLSWMASNMKHQSCPTAVNDALMP